MLNQYSYARKVEAAQTVKVYHYSEFPDSILEDGLLAASKLVDNKKAFKHVTENYKERIGKVYDGEIDDEIVLDFLDYYRSHLLDQFHGGRNMIFAMFQPIPSGISKIHDKYRKNSCFEINLTKLAKDKDVKFVAIELPGKDVANSFEEADLDRVKYYTEIDSYSMYDKKNADGLLFATIPHLAIWTPDGIIEKKYISLS